MAKYPYRMKCIKCNKEFIYRSEHAMLVQDVYDKIVATAICPGCKKKQKEKVNEESETLPRYELRKIEIKEDLTMGERLYCVIQDLEDYIMHNNLEQDKELDFICRQLNTIKEIYDGT